MKKLLNVSLFVVLVFMLASCTALNDYVETIRPVSHAPALTEEEHDFVDMLPALQSAGIAITNTITTDDKPETRRGSGVIVKKIEGTLTNTYYALTAQWVVEDAISVVVHLSPTENVTAVLLNPKLSYEADENIALISFSSSKDLKTVTLETLDEDEVLDYRMIFSIATPVSNSYFNYITNPAMIMGVYENRIVHGTNLNPGTLGSPLYLKSTGQLIGINVKYSFTSGGRPEVLLNEAIHINQVIELVEGYL